MTGAICGACHGAEAFPASVRSTAALVNNLGLEGLAGDLLAVRAGADPRADDHAPG
jgi:ADP-ribosylglycohydrolase